MTAIETMIKMMEASQYAFYRRLAKGDSQLFLRALYLADQEPATTQATIRKSSASASRSLAGFLPA